jgi:hypothetical protein
MIEQHFLEDTLLQLKKLKRQADKAIEQIDDEQFFATLDGEFVVLPHENRTQVLADWEDGWQQALSAISSLKPDDLSKTVPIRGEPHTVVEAINRQVSHYAAHVGQIVLLAKHYAGPRWQTLSIPRGKSKQFDVSKKGAPYAYKS